MASSHHFHQLLMSARARREVDVAHLLGVTRMLNMQAPDVAAPTATACVVPAQLGEIQPPSKIPQKRNPNELSTAKPVTSLEDFVKVPISTKLNNLALPKKNKAEVRTSVSARERPLRWFGRSYRARDQDVVISVFGYKNLDFESLIQKSLPNYLTASQPKRKALVGAIMSTITGNGGYFIRFDELQQSWTEVDKAQAERFTAQSLHKAASSRHDMKNPPPRAIIHPNVAAARVPKNSKPTLPATPIPFDVDVQSVESQDVDRLKGKRKIVEITEDGSVDDRSALLVKFKRPKVPPRKVSLESKSPLDVLSQVVASMDFGEW